MSGNRNSSRKSDSGKSGRNSFISFFPYISEEEAVAGLSDGSLVRGKLRVNEKNPDEAYCAQDVKDIFIEGTGARNRAIHGDDVVVRLRTSTTDGKQQKGDVVYVYDRIWDSRTFVCFLTRRNGEKYLEAQPINKRFPTIQLIDYVGDENSYLYYQEIEIISWDMNSPHPVGSIVKVVGEIGTIDGEEQATLIEFKLLSHTEFPNEVVEETNEIATRFKFIMFDTSVCVEESPLRESLLHLNVFTIDPETSRDLDDAINITRHDDIQNIVEVGVHIADVSHFVRPNTCLDKEAKRRCTSIYMPHKVLPMLPEVLSNNLCSLNPNEEKYAFSIFFQINIDTGEHVRGSERICKSLIKSRTRLSYNQVQSLIDNEASDILDESLREDILLLNQVAQATRRNRFAKGSVAINKRRMKFCSDPCHPSTDDTTSRSSSKILFNQICFDEHSESHELVEELMLLANQIVGSMLLSNQVQDAILRIHSPPDGLDNILQIANRICQDIVFEYGSSKSLQDSIDVYRQQVGDDAADLLSFLILKKMKSAEYIAVQKMEGISTKHYALGYDSYTHFTSPIRRYADILVHRQLATLLPVTRAADSIVRYEEAKAEQGQERCEITDESIDNLSKICSRCNELKNTARYVQESMIKTFFNFILRLREEPYRTRAIIKVLCKYKMVVFIPDLAEEKFIQYDPRKCDLTICHGREVKDEHIHPVKISNRLDESGIIITWKNSIQRSVNIYGSVCVALYPVETIPMDYIALITNDVI